MEFLQSFGIDGQMALFVALGCAGLCVVGIILSLILPILGGFLDIFVSIATMGAGAFSGEPISCCGCVVGFLACIVCTGITLFLVLVYPDCGTPDAINFCRFLP